MERTMGKERGRKERRERERKEEGRDHPNKKAGYGLDRCYKIPRTPIVGSLNTRGGKICDFRPQSPFIFETVRDRSMVTAEH